MLDSEQGKYSVKMGQYLYANFPVLTAIGDAMTEENRVVQPAYQGHTMYW